MTNLPSTIDIDQKLSMQNDVKEQDESIHDERTSGTIQNSVSGSPEVPSTTASNMTSSKKRSYDETDIIDDNAVQDSHKDKKTCTDLAPLTDLNPTVAIEPNAATSDVIESKPSKPTLPSSGPAHLTVPAKILTQLYGEGKTFSITIREQARSEAFPSEPEVKDFFGTVKTVELHENGLVFQISSFTETKSAGKEEVRHEAKVEAKEEAMGEAKEEAKEDAKEEAKACEKAEDKVGDDEPPNGRTRPPAQASDVSGLSPKQDVSEDFGKGSSPKEDSCATPKLAHQDTSTKSKPEPSAQSDPPKSESESDSEDDFEITTDSGKYCGKKPADKKPAENNPIKKPIEQKPIKQKPIEKKPIEKTPAQKKPVQTFHRGRNKFYKNNTWRPNKNVTTVTSNPTTSASNGNLYEINSATVSPTCFDDGDFYGTGPVSGKRAREVDEEEKCSVESEHSSKRPRSSCTSPAAPTAPITQPLVPPTTNSLSPAAPAAINAAQAQRAAKQREQAQAKQRKEQQRADYRASTNPKSAALQATAGTGGILQPSTPSSLNVQHLSSSAPSPSGPLTRAGGGALQPSSPSSLNA
ncbi:MAG: hypothetical protein Q9174_005393, partial [Haloplaca sp. 1 TL-2023]